MSPNETNPSDEGLWDAEDVARFFKMSRSWVYHRVYAGRLPCRYFGSAMRFDPDVIRKYDEGRSVTKRPRRLRKANAALRREP